MHPLFTYIAIYRFISWFYFFTTLRTSLQSQPTNSLIQRSHFSHNSSPPLICKTSKEKEKPNRLSLLACRITCRTCLLLSSPFHREIPRHSRNSVQKQRVSFVLTPPVVLLTFPTSTSVKKTNSV